MAPRPCTLPYYRHVKEFRLLWIVAGLLSAFLSPCATVPLNAQTDDWQAVQRIPPGSSISIKVLNHRGRHECELLTVTYADLSCDLQRGMFERRLNFLRAEIGEVRLEYPERHHMIPGAIIGGALGTAIELLLAGGSSDPETQRVAPVLAALVGVSFGGGVGRAIHQHGPVVYRRK